MRTQSGDLWVEYRLSLYDPLLGPTDYAAAAGSLGALRRHVDPSPPHSDRIEALAQRVCEDLDRRLLRATKGQAVESSASPLITGDSPDLISHRQFQNALGHLHIGMQARSLRSAAEEFARSREAVTRQQLYGFSIRRAFAVRVPPPLEFDEAEIDVIVQKTLRSAWDNPDSDLRRAAPEVDAEPHSLVYNIERIVPVLSLVT